MLERILRLYTMAMLGDVRSPLPHLFGPPGCGKSSTVEQAAELLGVNLHIINVSRLSPLEVEGVQMPHGTGEEMILKMLPATFWTQLKEGDILLLDEFLRGFPEVYNALLDILTSRRVGAFVLPRIFIIGASNSTVAYDKALEDRLLHIPVDDPRKKKGVKNALGQRIVDALGLMPEMTKTQEMATLLTDEVLPMYAILDQLGSNTATTGNSLKGCSLRNLIGQVQLREIRSPALVELIAENNRRARAQEKYQFMVLPDGVVYDQRIIEQLNRYATEEKIQRQLTDLQKLNIHLNLQLISMEDARKEGIADDTVGFDDDIFAD